MKVYAFMLGAAALAAPVLGLTLKSASPEAETADVAAPFVNPNAPRPAMSTEELVALRNAMTAQLGVYDAVEQTWRAPTPAERAELAQGASEAAAPTVTTLPNGTVVYQPGANDLSFLTVAVQPDGTVTMGHVDDASAASAETEEDHHAE